MPGSTRQQGEEEALDQALAEAVSRVRNEPRIATDAFVAMRESLTRSKDPDVCVTLLKRVVATALSCWTPSTSDPAAFAAAAAKAGFEVSLYTAAGAPSAAVVREGRYPSSLKPEQPLLKSLARAFATDVLTPALAHARGLPGLDASARAFLDTLPELVRTGSLDAPLTPKATPLPRFHCS